MTFIIALLCCDITVAIAVAIVAIIVATVVVTNEMLHRTAMGEWTWAAYHVAATCGAL